MYPIFQVLQWSVQGGEIVGIPKPLTKDFLLQGIIQARDDETCGGFHGCASRSHRNSVKVRAAEPSFELANSQKVPGWKKNMWALLKQQNGVSMGEL